MFAVLHASSETPLDTLVEVAQAFTPRFQVLGPFVLLDVGGLSALFETPQALGDAIHGACPTCRSVALASTAAAAMLLACGREGVTVLEPEAQKVALAQLPIDVLVEVTEARWTAAVPVAPVSSAPGPVPSPTGAPVRLPGGPTPSSRSGPTPPSRSGPTPPPRSGPTPPPRSGPILSPAVGWRHPRDTHQAHHTRRPRPQAAVLAGLADRRQMLHQSGATLRRWGIHRLGALAALPRSDVHARLGDLGVSWQRLAGGEDEEPLVPWLAEPVFEGALELEWPIEGFEPLSFVLARLLEPLSVCLERADRGAVAIQTALHLTTRQVHVRVIPLPAPMRDPKTLRTLVLLDLESHPPPAAVDRVHVRLEPTPGRVLQWTLFARAQPAPEQVATLLARLTALMGDGHVGSPALVDTWRPGAFRVAPFSPPAPADDPPRVASEAVSVPLAFRRFRLPVPVRVRVEDGRPIRVTTDRRGITGGAIVQSAGPWRTSGEWWAATRMDRDATDRERGSGRESEGMPERADRDRRDLTRRESIRGGEREESREGVEFTRDRAGSGAFSEPRNGEQSREIPVLSRSASGASREVSVPSRQSAPWDRDEWDIAMADGTVYRLSVERDVGQWCLEGVFD